jgi:hypothetical protein
MRCRGAWLISLSCSTEDGRRDPERSPRSGSERGLSGAVQRSPPCRTLAGMRRREARLGRAPQRRNGRAGRQPRGRRSLLPGVRPPSRCRAGVQRITDRSHVTASPLRTATRLVSHSAPTPATGPGASSERVARRVRTGYAAGRVVLRATEKSRKCGPFLARPRGFEPLTLGSVDRGVRNDFGSSKPNQIAQGAENAPKILGCVAHRKVIADARGRVRLDARATRPTACW